MKRIPVVITLVVVMASLAVSQTGEKPTGVFNTTQQEPSVERELLQLSRELAEAAVNRNVTVYDRILADDYMVTYTNGEIATKAQHIAMLNSRVGGPKEIAKMMLRCECMETQP